MSAIKPQAGDDAAVAAWVKKLGGTVTLQENRNRAIDLSRTPVSDSQLASLSSLTAIEKLVLASTQVGDVGLQSLARLNSLRELDLSNTMTTGKGMAQLSGLKYLESLRLNNSQVRGGFESIGALPIAMLELSGAPVNDAGLPSHHQKP